MSLEDTHTHTHAQSNFIDSRAVAIKSTGRRAATQAATQDADRIVQRYVSMNVCVCVFMFGTCLWPRKLTKADKSPMKLKTKSASAKFEKGKGKEEKKI